MKAELWFPNTIVAGGEPQGDSITEELPVKESYDYANPMHESNFIASPC